MTSEELSKYISDIVDSALVKNQSTVIKELSSNITASTNNALGLTSQIVVNSMRLTAHLSIKATLEILEQLGVLELSECKYIYSKPDLKLVPPPEE